MVTADLLSLRTWLYKIADQPVPQRAPRGEPVPGQGVGHVRSSKLPAADSARRGRLAARRFLIALLEGASTGHPLRS